VSGVVELRGPRRIVSLAPANTSEATMFTAGREGSVIACIHICNTSGSARTATVKWGDSSASTDYAILSAYSISANTIYTSPDALMAPLQEGDTIKVTSSAANDLTFTLLIVETAFAFGGDAIRFDTYQPDYTHNENIWLKKDRSHNRA
jgi:hypothetical protein